MKLIVFVDSYIGLVEKDIRARGILVDHLQRTATRQQLGHDPWQWKDGFSPGSKVKLASKGNLSSQRGRGRWFMPFLGVLKGSSRSLLPSSKVSVRPAWAIVDQPQRAVDVLEHPSICS